MTSTHVLVSVLGLATAGCAGVYEQQLRGGLRIAGEGITHEAPPEAEIGAADGSLNAYVALALAHSPEVIAEFERWRAATLKISRARRLPEPVLSYGFYVQSVETRVGPQRHRIGLSQTFPWPTKLSAGADAGSAQAAAARRRFDAKVLNVRHRVADAYWTLWLIQEEHRLKSEHDIVLETLAGTVRGRVETGQASLADLNQVELGVARHHDHHGVHLQASRAASARVVAAIGAVSVAHVLQTRDAPLDGAPSVAGLAQAARSHPGIEAHELLAEASEHRARAAAADYFPRIRVGFDYIETGEAAMAGVADSGKDPMIVSAALSLPIWWTSYADAEEAALAQRDAHRFDELAAARRAEAQLAHALARVQDAQRRINLHRDTLLPQALTTYQSVLGSYQTGRSTVAAMLLAQRDLLELQLDLARSRAEHARGWAQLESVVGRAVERTSSETKPASSTEAHHE